MIIIEGMDKTGKTTLAEALALRMRRQIAAFGVPPIDVFEYHSTGVERAGRSAIIDRLHWSEYAYGKTYRAGCGYTAERWAELEGRLESLDAFTIMMTDELPLVRQRWEWSQEPFDPEKLVELNNHFTDLYLRRSKPISRLPAILMNYRDLFDHKGQTTARFEAVVREIEEAGA